VPAGQASAAAPQSESTFESPNLTSLLLQKKSPTTESFKKTSTPGRPLPHSLGSPPESTVRASPTTVNDAVG
jgi:hypothetical protein